MNPDDDEMMDYIVREHDSIGSPWRRARFLDQFNISPELLSSFRERLASRNSTPDSTTEQTPTPPVSPVRRKSRGSRRPSTPRGTSGPRSYTFTRRTTQKSRRSGTTKVVTTVTTVVTTVVTTTSH
ncbi:hypothetical protein [Streptomyces albidoflavus]|uniref:hypothetical protein n=1 Tax=Streptomyces albidoflavus TaxID=1886 RepID=UPI0002F25084